MRLSGNVNRWAKGSRVSLACFQRARLAHAACCSRSFRSRSMVARVLTGERFGAEGFHVKQLTEMLVNSWSVLQTPTFFACG